MLVLGHFAEQYSLDNKVIIITGGSSGIGYGCAKFLSAMGARVVIFDLKDLEDSQKDHDMVSAASFIYCDVTSESSCRQAVEQVKSEFGRIDALINCAGVIKRKTVVDLEVEEWDLVIDVGLKGVYLVSKYVIPVMIANDGGSIVNIGSGWGIKGGPMAAAYCAAKGGVVNLTRAMAIDHGPQNIRVNCLCPGDVDTPLLRDEAHQLGIDLEQWLIESADRPIKRLGDPLDIAKAVYFLVSDLSPWVSGATLVVDGGGTA
jgi:NAD(P)-dependent dehydrogenase (short-subunit alcohol dehydrogenase family)